MPVRSVHPNSPKSDISRVPLVDPFEASTFVVSKRVEEHAAGRYALATLLRDIGFDPYDLQIIRDQHRKPTLGWRDETARLRAGGVDDLCTQHPKRAGPGGDEKKMGSRMRGVVVVVCC